MTIKRLSLPMKTKTRIPSFVLSLMLCFWLTQVTISQEEEQCADPAEEGREKQRLLDSYYAARKQAEKEEYLAEAAKIKYATDTYPCFDEIKTCPKLAKYDGCIENFSMMRLKCRKTCQLCVPFVEDEISNIYSTLPQQTQGPSADQVRKFILESDHYMYNTVYVDEEYASVRTDCKNRHDLCSFWAQLGECQANEIFMRRQCAPACQSCLEVSIEARCPHDPSEPTAFQAGDLYAMFTRIVTDPEYQKKYSPVIYSQPKAKQQPTAAESNNSTKEPWVVVLDNFLTPDECETLINLGTAQGYELSLDVGERNFDGTYQSAQSQQRTSTNAWCTHDCWEHEVTQAVHERIEDVTGVPRINYEYLQLLRYEPQQFYGRHHDYVPHHEDRSFGPRILTVFLYLNDVEEGGGTNFPLIQTTVMPKQGRALIWPSVLNDDPMKKDRTTEHQALPVTKGVKYGANAWIHQRDFKTPWAKGCQ